MSLHATLFMTRRGINGHYIKMRLRGLALRQQAYASKLFPFYNRTGTRGLLQLCRVPNPLQPPQTMRGIKVAPHSTAVDKGVCIATFGLTHIQSLADGLESEWRDMLVHVSGRGAQRLVVYPAWPLHELQAAGPFINHSTTQANVRLVASRHGVRFVATRRIAPGRELLTRYGLQYARLLNGGRQ